MTDPFEASSRYYDLLYQEKDSAAEAAYVDALLQRHGISGPELLEFGSGTGRHGCLLTKRGYRVRGLERSAATTFPKPSVSLNFWAHTRRLTERLCP